ncbi:MAG: hypothetical protein ACI89G_002696 [Minisyncoccia bacterium]|jgi:hypothetical protein
MTITQIGVALTSAPPQDATALVVALAPDATELVGA